MPDYAYIARNASGQRVEGVLSAGTQGEVLAALSARQLFPVTVEAKSTQAARGTTRRVPAQARAQFYMQLAALLRSGVPLLQITKSSQ